MKVFCINDNGWCIDRSILWGLIKWEQDAVGPAYGEICTVTREYVSRDGRTYYDLQEWPPEHDDDGYLADCFIPIQDTEEEESEVESDVVEISI